MLERVITATESEEREAGSIWRKGADVRGAETCFTRLSVVCSKIDVEFLLFLLYI
jgi:hypothetical protein